MKDDAQRVAVSRPDAADAMPEIDPIHSPSTSHRSMVNSKHNSVSLAKRHYDRA